MRKLVGLLVGIVTIVLLFPIGGTTGCADGTSGGRCESWSDSIPVRYPTDNGAVGMGIAVGAGVLVAMLVYLIAQRLFPAKG
jgi:ABC-type antimicrobial peptide transport system permease subunit